MVNVTNGSYSNGTTYSSNGYSPEEHPEVDTKILPIRSRQEMVFSDEYKPVGKPIKKVGAERCVCFAIHLISIALSFILLPSAY
jgi:indole-3-acetaldehyde oxidase